MSEALWTPSPERVIKANMTEFLRYVEERGGPPVPDYSPDSYWQLHEWSLNNPERFWSLIWRFCGIVGHRGTGGGAERVGVGLDHMGPPDPVASIVALIASSLQEGATTRVRCDPRRNADAAGMPQAG